MTLALFAAALISASISSAELPYQPDEYSELERHLDVALENMISAQTYICDDLQGPPGATDARRRYDRVDRRFEDAKTKAETRLGRRLNLKVWVNSCRIRNPGASFLRKLRVAGRELDVVERLLSNGKPA